MHNKERILHYLSGKMDEKEKNKFERELSESKKLSNELTLIKNELNEFSLLRNPELEQFEINTNNIPIGTGDKFHPPVFTFNRAAAFAFVMVLFIILMIRVNNKPDNEMMISDLTDSLLFADGIDYLDYSVIVELSSQENILDEFTTQEINRFFYTNNELNYEVFLESITIEDHEILLELMKSKQIL